MRLYPNILRQLKKNNPGTITCLKVEPYALEYGSIVLNIVRCGRVFWAFGPSIEGFSSCRELLSIDGTYLYEMYRGYLLIATEVDADGGFYPLTFVVVESELENFWW